MASLVNIGAANAKDEFYRYKMPQLVCRSQGKGNGIKTSIENVVDVAKSLSRDVKEVMKFFSYELGTPVIRDDQGRYMINGQTTSSTLTILLEKYITCYILCPRCGNPETKYEVKKKQLMLQCSACGCTTNATCQDHKITEYILKQHMVSSNNKKT